MRVTYSERLHVPWWWLVVGFVIAGSMAVAVLAYVRPAAGITFSVLFMVGLFLLVFAYSRTRLAVDSGTGLRAGRYTLETTYIAGATALEGDAARRALGPEADHQAFLFTRPFLGSLVRVDLADPADPHPYWLISTRRPHELVAALDRVKVAA